MKNRSEVENTQDLHSSARTTEAVDRCQYKSGRIPPVHFPFFGVPDDGDSDPQDLEFEAEIIWLSVLAAQ
jgi:hypothetical protein